MKWIHACFCAVFAMILIQLAVRFLEESYELRLGYQRGWLVSADVWIVSVSSGLAAFGVSILQWETFTRTELVLAMLLIWGMGVLTITDYQRQVIPNRVLLVLTGLWAVVLAATLLFDITAGLDLALQALFGGVLGGVIFFACYLLSKKQLGAGDVKLAVVMGLYLTARYVLYAYFIGTLLCCVCSVALVLGKKLGWKDGIALAPFLTVGMWMTLLIA